MVKTCGQCRYTGEPTWRDGNYYCPACGAVMDMTAPSPQPIAPPQPAATPINAVCPICRNANGNTLVNGKCRCGMCGTLFDYATPTPQYQNGYAAPGPYQNGYAANANAYAYAQQRRRELEAEKNKRVVWGIVWFFLCWPVAVYHAYKYYKANEELKTYSQWY